MFGAAKRKAGSEPKTKKRWQEELEAPSDDDDRPLPARSAVRSRSPSPATSPPRKSPSRSPSPPPQRSVRDVFGSRNPHVFLEIGLGGRSWRDARPAGRVEFELFAKDCPRTAENFRQLCTGEAGQGAKTKMDLCYEGCKFHRIIPGFMAQGGDFERGDGTGGESIYGGEFEDEAFAHRHSAPGLLSMANAGRHTNGSQFFVLFGRAPHLDGKHVVFGRLVKGMELVREMEALGSKSGEPRQQVIILACGEVHEDTAPKSSQGPESRRSEGHPEDTRRHAGRSRSRSRSRERAGHSAKHRSASERSHHRSRDQGDRGRNEEDERARAKHHYRERSRRSRSGSRSRSRSRGRNRDRR